MDASWTQLGRSWTQLGRNLDASWTHFGKLVFRGFLTMKNLLRTRGRQCMTSCAESHIYNRNSNISGVSLCVLALNKLRGQFGKLRGVPFKLRGAVSLCSGAQHHPVQQCTGLTDGCMHRHVCSRKKQPHVNNFTACNTWLRLHPRSTAGCGHYGYPNRGKPRRLPSVHASTCLPVN